MLLSHTHHDDVLMLLSAEVGVLWSRRTTELEGFCRNHVLEQEVTSAEEETPPAGAMALFDRLSPDPAPTDGKVGQTASRRWRTSDLGLQQEQRSEVRLCSRFLNLAF